MSRRMKILPPVISTLALAFGISSGCGACGSGQLTSNTSTATQGPYVLLSENNGYVWKCSLNTTTGALSSCVTETQVPSGDLGFDYSAMTLNKTGSTTYAYLTNVQFNGIPLQKCTVAQGTDDVASCAATASDSNYGWLPQGITFYESGGQTYAYVADGSNSNQSHNSLMWLCSVSQTTGDVSSCVTTPTDASLPTATNFYGPLAMNTASGTTYAYVPDSGAGAIWQCPVNPSTGALSACAKTATDGSLTDAGSTGTFSWISFVQLSGGTSAYISDSQGYIWLCAVSSSTGALSACAKTPADASLPVVTYQYAGLGFYEAGGNFSAYVTDASGNLWQCGLNSTTGALSACTQSDTGIAAGDWSPDAIVFP